MPSSWRCGQARRGERLRRVLPGRPLRELSRARRQADDRRLERPRRPCPGDRADRPGRARLAGHVPPPGQLRQGRDHGRRDERRADRGRRGGGLERGGASPARPRRSRRSSERADLLEDQLAILHGLWGEPDGWSYEGVTGLRVEGALFRPRPVDVAGPAADARRGPAADHRRRAGDAALVPARGALRRRVQPQLRRRPSRRGGGPGPLDEACRRSAATRRRSPARRWSACSSGETRKSWPPASGRCSRRSGPTSSPMGRRGSTSGASAGSTARPTRRASSSVGSPTPGSSRVMLQDFLPWDLEHIDVMGEELVGRA